MKKSVVVTLSDDKYVEQAKQLFASVHYNAGWKGDYMLLSLDIPESKLAWFRARGILIKKCAPLFDYLEHKRKILLTKLELFKDNMKNWKSVVFLDSDIIVRASIDDLADVDGFGAVRGVGLPKIRNRFKSVTEEASSEFKHLYNKLNSKYNLDCPGFNGGVYAFNTDIIKKETFSELKRVFQQYEKLILQEDESVLGLMFCDKWVRLPLIYNTYLHHYKMTHPNKAVGIVLHFVHCLQPWLPESPFHAEWKRNLELSETMQVRDPVATSTHWTGRQKKMASLNLGWRFMRFRAKRRLKYSIIGQLAYKLLRGNKIG